MKTLWASILNEENARCVQVRLSSDTLNALLKLAAPCGLHVTVTALPQGSLPIVQTLWEALALLLVSAERLPALRKEVFK